MPNEKFNATIGECRLYAADAKKGLHSTSFLSAKWMTADGISGSFSLSGPKEAMLKMFGSWPVILTDPEKTAELKLPVEIVISTAGANTAGQQMNAMAAEAAQQNPAAEAPPAEGLESMKAQIEQLAK